MCFIDASKAFDRVNMLVLHGLSQSCGDIGIAVFCNVLFFPSLYCVL